MEKNDKLVVLVGVVLLCIACTCISFWEPSGITDTFTPLIITFSILVIAVVLAAAIILLDAAQEVTSTTPTSTAPIRPPSGEYAPTHNYFGNEEHLQQYMDRIDQLEKQIEKQVEQEKDQQTKKKQNKLKYQKGRSSRTAKAAELMNNLQSTKKRRKR